MKTETFVPDCYGIRSNGQPMPARFIALDPAGFLELEAPNGRTYTFAPDHVLPVDEVESQLRHDRIGYVAANYQFEEMSSGHGRREVRCVNPAHPIRSNYVLTITRSRRSCTCQAFVKSAGEGCKHLEAYALKEAAAETETKRPAPQTYTAEEW